MKAVKSTVEQWPVTHPVIRAALMDEDVCPDCGHGLDKDACPACGAPRQKPRDLYFG
jgi:rubrerythrin